MSPVVFGGPPWWFGLLGVIAAAALFALVTFVVLVMLRSVVKGGGPPWPGARCRLSHAEDPEHVLARRFANGEIDEEEFRRRLEVLRSWRGERRANWEHGGG